MERKTEVKARAKNKNSQKTIDRSWTFMIAPRCGAKTRKGTPCQAPAMKNGRCRMHGGKSTGPKTPEGIERIRQAHLKHGLYTKESIATRKEFNALVKQMRNTLKEIDEKGKKIAIKI